MKRKLNLKIDQRFEWIVILIEGKKYLNVQWPGSFFAHPKKHWSKGVPEGLCSREGDLARVRCGN